MKTPYLNEEIKQLTGKLLSPYGESILSEYKAIKSFIENSPIVSTPEKPVWVVDEDGNKRILLADLGEKIINGRYILVTRGYTNDFLQNRTVDYSFSDVATPYTPKVTIEVTEEEATKVEEFLKSLRNEK
jgi:hypothetical protein